MTALRVGPCFPPPAVPTRSVGRGCPLQSLTGADWATGYSYVALQETIQYRTSRRRKGYVSLRPFTFEWKCSFPFGVPTKVWGRRFFEFVCLYDVDPNRI